jgi:hypothetical protein
MLMANLPFLRIREEGRWTSDSSLRRYLDAVAVMAGEAASALAPYLPVIQSLEENFNAVFRWW